MASAGERTPNWPHSYGVLTGIRQGGMRPGLLYRAALEGATFSLVNGKYALPLMASQVSLSADTLKALRWEGVL